MDALSSKLTQVAAYRQTTCRVQAEDYALRKINGEEELLVQQAKAARSAMVEAAYAMVQDLHWADFETMVDLIFARAGWQRTSRVGETMKDVDLVIDHPTTGEKAFVQVKSRANQKVLDDYIGRFRRSAGFDRMFFVCHSPKGELSADIEEKLHLWTGKALAATAVNAGLFDWLLERTG